jgi:glyoxylase-like metal-dependent hydrolase (beta-lactamase superfamily II)
MTHTDSHAGALAAVAALIGFAPAAPVQAQRTVDQVLVRELPTTDATVRTADVTVRGYTEGDFPRITRIAENVYVYESLQHQGAIEPVFTTNCFIVVTSEGVLVADGLENEPLVKDLVAAIGHLTRQPIRYYVVGADHGDHTGGNAAFPETTTFLASTASIANMARRAAANPNAVHPSRLVPYQEVKGGKTVLKLGGTEIDILDLGRAHTGGDLEVYLPAQKILWMSEAYFNRLFPSTYSSYPREHIAALDKAVAMDAWIYLPAHGFIDSRKVLNEELLAFRACLAALDAEGHRLHDARVPLEGAPRLTRLGPYAYWTRAAYNLPDGLKRVYQEADGQLD